MGDVILEEDAMCTVCLDLYDDPVLLDCAHNMCTKCAKQLFEFEARLQGVTEPNPLKPHAPLVAANTHHHQGATGGSNTRKPCAPGRRMTCPECRQVTAMPENGVEGLKRNLVLRNMVDTLRERRAARQQTKCGICEERPALWECKECQFEMCQECRDSDHRRGRYKEHSIFPLGKIAKMRPRKCRDHDGYLTDLYCTQCQVAVCLLCNYMGAHKGHTVEPITEAVDGIKKKLRAAADDVDEKAKKVAETIADVEANAAPSMAVKCDEAVMAVKQHFSALHEVLATRQDHVLGQIHLIREAKAAALAAHVETLRAVSGQMEDATKTCRRMLEESHYSDLLRSKESIHNRLTQLGAVRWSAKAPTECDLRVSFDATDASVRRLLADVGTVVCKDPLVSAPTVEMPQPNATQQFHLPHGANVREPSAMRDATRLGGPFLSLAMGGAAPVGGRGKAPREEPLVGSNGKRPKGNKSIVVPSSAAVPPPSSKEDGIETGTGDDKSGKWVLRI